ncbi:hypothetical protein [Oribacterium parvum]|nr:hypothetical protein [Oribacterium parvum]
MGDEKQDYGKGFYLTDNLEPAKEWLVCRPDDRITASIKEPKRLTM